MKLSLYGQQMAAPSVIAELMTDLGDALNNNPELLFLGGGNPALIPDVTEIFSAHLREMVDSPRLCERWLGVYQSPQGHESLLEALVVYLRGKGWPVNRDNLVVVNGGQTACHRLFNLLAGPSETGLKKILLPMVPEYVGYRGLLIGGDAFEVHLPTFALMGDTRFRYVMDKTAVVLSQESGLICLSRPTNPSANVMPVADVEWLFAEAQRAGIPLLIDNAYGSPFPNIQEQGGEIPWQPGMINVLSTSKLGLPGVRTAVLVADKDIINLMVRAGAVENLAAGNTGAFLLERLITSGDIDRLTATVPMYYRKQRLRMLSLLDVALAETPYRIHEPEGAFFIWLWLPQLPISSLALYQRLKARGVLVMAGEGFFFGADTSWPHAKECLRLNICQEDSVMERAVAIIAEEVMRAYAGV